MSIITSALAVLPSGLRESILKAVNISGSVYEIRLVAERSVYLRCAHGIRFVDKNGNTSLVPTRDILKPTSAELDEICDRALGYSGFSRQGEVTGGYIGYSQGIRIGIACDGEGTDMGVGKITSLCIRIPYDGSAVPDVDYPSLLSFDTGLLIAGAPSSGKTTLLRGIAAYLSGGEGHYRRVTVIDERCELFTPCLKGECIDLIRGKDKARAISHAVRVLSPEYVICDEIGSQAEGRSLLEGLHCGVRFICSIHAGSLDSLIRRRQFRLLFSESVFDRVAVLSSERVGKISRIYSFGEVEREIRRTYGALPCNSTFGDLYSR